MSQCCKTNNFWVIVLMQKFKNKKNDKSKIRKSEHDTHILFCFWSKKIFGSKISYYWKYGLWGGVLNPKDNGQHFDEKYVAKRFWFFQKSKKLNISTIYKAIFLLYNLQVLQFFLIQPPGEPSEQHLGDVRPKNFDLHKIS